MHGTRPLARSPSVPTVTPRSTPIRIAQLANFVGPTSGGMKVAVGHLGAGYVAAGAERLLVVPGPVTTMRHTPEGIVMTVRARQVPGGYRMILDARPVLDALEAFGPTSIELSDKWTLTAALGWARRRGVPTALFSHERLDAMLPLRLGLERGLTRPIAMYNTLLRKRADAIVVTSDFAAQEFRRLTPANPAPIHRVPLGVDLDGFRPPCAPPPDGGMIRLVHVGRLSREKHPHLAVRTALALHARGIPVRLDVYGEGPHRQELEALAGSGPVTFHGHLPDRHALARAIGGAHASLSVSPGETFGLAVLEALA